eukprot:TRINITY_DN7334_c0_g1_i1.p1 TRINITY_DN7334_c0_g1~~TRINITY_DN7334_c0_g1_i1.p1  ORF type:complete len:665 (-),score=86.05 TRINITY_DN7334_c0_g1_i1:15-2009(-)
MSVLVPGGDQLRNAILKRKEKVGRCSWCFCPDPIPHHTEERYLFIRDLFHCTQCQRKTIRCREKSCKDFARAYDGLLLNDTQCFQHQKIIDAWEGAKTRDQLTMFRYCSWCFKKSYHSLIHYKKRIYECGSCYRVGSSCKGCDVALSRNGALGGDKCLLCSGVITEWTTQEKENYELTGWCSICFEFGTHSLLERKKIPGPFLRDEYMCNTCASITARCSEPYCQNMVRNCFNHRKCLKCTSPKEWDWEAISARKQIFMAPYTAELIRENLSRDTPEKQLAYEKGMIRPFLFLVSMHPAARSTLALTLGLYLLRKSFYGDPHIEAWYVISHKTRGILFRGSERLESMRMVSSSWYKIQRRVERAVFKGKDIGERLDRRKARKQSSDKGMAIEMDFMDKLALQQRSKFSVEKTELIEKMLDKPAFVSIKATLEKQGIPRTTLYRWLIEMMIDTILQQNDRSEMVEPEELAVAMKDLIQQQVIQGRGYFYTKKRQQEIAVKTATVGVTIAVQQLIIIPILPAVGVAYIVFRISDALTEKLFGSEPELLYPTVQQLLTQRLFLAYLGINIDDFYKEEFSTPETPIQSPYTSSIVTAVGIRPIEDDDDDVIDMNDFMSSQHISDVGPSLGVTNLPSVMNGNTSETRNKHTPPNTPLPVIPTTKKKKAK